MLPLAGIIITFFLVILLAGKKGNSKADKILALWLGVTGLHLLSYYIYITGTYTSFPYLLGWEIPMPLLHGPFLFLYTSALTHPSQNRKTTLLHFVPFVLAFLSLLPFFSLPFSKQIEIYQKQGAGYELLVNIILGAVMISGVVYTLLSLRVLAKHRRAIKEQFSFTEKINLKWLFYLIIGSSIIWILVIFSHDEFIFTAVVLYVFFIGYFGIKQVGIFTNQIPQLVVDRPAEFRAGYDVTPAEKAINSADPQNLNSGQPATIKYEKSRISAGEMTTIHQNLSALMQKEKLFKEPELSLSEIAQKLDVHPNTLSQVINSLEQKNFYEYINLQRIEEFKQLVMLPGNQKYTLLSLAFECGFNSKTSFNRNFKKATGLSPSEYLKQVNVQLES